MWYMLSDVRVRAPEGLPWRITMKEEDQASQLGMIQYVIIIVLGLMVVAKLYERFG